MLTVLGQEPQSSEVRIPMSLPVHIEFVASELPAHAAYRDVAVAKVYSVVANGYHIGWVTYSANKQWVCWNEYGDFWSSFGTTRAKAGEALVDAPWRNFYRAKAA